MTHSYDKDRGPRQLASGDLRPVKFAHIVLRTHDYAAMRRFYLTFLNARPAYENDMLCFVRYDDEHHRVVLVNTPLPTQKEPAAGLEHFAFTFASLGELLGNYRRLKAEGILPVWCINHGMTTSLYYRDPDGNNIETQYDNLDNDAADAFMRGPYFAKNPIGVDLDPELLIARYERGDALADLIKQGSALPAADAPLPPGVPLYDRRGALL